MKKPGLPEAFLERLAQIVGQSNFSTIEKTFAERPTTFRLNSLKYNDLQNSRRPAAGLPIGMGRQDRGDREILQPLQEQGFKFDKVDWYNDAFILRNKSKRELTETEVYKNGEIYIQSLASMVPPLILAPQTGEKVLDLTAAPGSKTSQIAALMNREGELVANDNSKIRFFKLKHNMELLGVANAVETRFIAPEFSVPDPSDKWKFNLRMEHGSKLAGDYPNYFDKILLDAPCSAEARFVLGDPKTSGFWSEHKIKEMAYKQRQLLFSALVALKPGGIMVYSTCTFSPEENELQITRLLERFPNSVKLLPVKLVGVKSLPAVREWKGKAVSLGIQKNCLRILPTAEIEGFFIAKLQKI